MVNPASKPSLSFPCLVLAAALVSILSQSCGLNASGDVCTTCGGADGAPDTTRRPTLDGSITHGDTGTSVHHDGGVPPIDSGHDGSVSARDATPPTDAPRDTGTRRDTGTPDTGVDTGSGACTESCPIGSSCTTSPPCCSGYCNGTVCARTGTAGTCCTDADCLSGFCAPNKTCGPPACAPMNGCPVGNFCDNGGAGNGQCCSNVCTSNTCAPLASSTPGAMGAWCCSGTDCLSGNCGAGSKCGPPACAMTFDKCTVGHYCDNSMGMGNGECCSNVCTSNACAAPAATPIMVPGACCDSTECCTDNCSGDACQKSNDGAHCCKNGDCNSGHCSSDSAPAGTIGNCFTPGGGH